MDNITHSLLGAALAEVALPTTPKAPRRLFYVAGIAAANFPDLDILYSWITPAPLGYLLHHRGHTHTVAGLVAQALLLGGIYYALRSVRQMERPVRNRLWMLLLIALASHVILDAMNSYGVHPFYPITSRWYYGDAVFIFEPWIWLLLGVPLALAASRRIIRVGLLILLVVLPLALAFAGMVPWAALGLLLVVVAGLVFGLRNQPARTNAVTGVAAGAAFAIAVLLLSGIVEARARHLLTPLTSGNIVDVVGSADPANPVCWSLIAIERDDAAGEYVMRPATLSVLPGVLAPTSCASHRFRRRGNHETVGGQLAAYDVVRQSLDTLRSLNATDCSVRAWLQFGRAPVIGGGQILDYRFARGGDNFSAMTLRPAGEASACPPNVTSWDQPRADLLTP